MQVQGRDGLHLFHSLTDGGTGIARSKMTNLFTLHIKK